ncbi:MAG: hypothetical protein ACLUEK_09625 [Oscillospiraceae bacterium]
MGRCLRRFTGPGIGRARLDKNLRTSSAAMQGGEYPDVIHLATGRRGLTSISSSDKNIMRSPTFCP